MINCYGFGYTLKSDILNEISSRISGGDGYSFIFRSLIVNIFIHGVSNFFTTAATYIQGKVVFTDNSDKSFEINSIKYGQTKNVIFELDKESIICRNEYM